MEQFDSLEEQVKNMLVSIVEQAMENIESETVTIMELGSYRGNLADTIVPNMDKEKYRYCYTHVSTVFLDEVRTLWKDRKMWNIRFITLMRRLPHRDFSYTVLIY